MKKTLPDEAQQTLLLQRKTIHRIARAVDNFKKLGEKNITLAHTKGRLAQLEKNINECRTQHAQLEFLTPADVQETEDYFTENEFEAAEDAYQEAYDLFRAYLERLSAPEVPSLNESLNDTANASAPPRVNVKLPTIQLPKFTGSYTDYRSFSDLFTSLIDQNSTLSATQRMHYLVSCLEGEPKELIKNLTISEANYRIALETLAQRYDNQRIIVLTHLTELIELKACTKASASEIKRVRDKFAEVLGALTALNRPVDQWDDVLIALLLHKLDSRTRREWEIEIKDITDVPQYDTLDHFVLGQIRAFDVYDQAVLPLGRDNGGGSTAEAATTATPMLTASVHLSRLEPRSRETRLLATAWVVLRASNGRSVRIRALLDPGSEATFVTESKAQLLRLPRRKVAVPVSGLGGTASGFIKSSVLLTVEPSVGTGPSIPVEALVIKKVTAYAPTHSIDLNEWESLRNLPLADPNPSSKNAIEMIIGVDIYGLLLLPEIRQTSGRGSTAQSTILGWVIFGPVTNTMGSREPVRVHHVIRGFELENELRRFWEIEEPPSELHLTEDEIICEEHFKQTHTRDHEGRYVVRLPFKNGRPPAVGRSLKQAMCCLNSLERRLAKDEETRRLYTDFLTEYLAMEHMERVSDLVDSEQYIYLPHHPVCRKDSETTKLRVVFNASSGTSNGTTLNSHLLAGPKLQTDLPSIITKWRLHRLVFTADIAKMFRQIWIDPRDLNYQRILWRDRKTNEITGYRLRTVTYGTASAPYLAIRVLHQLAEDEKDNYPEAAVLLRENFYVDDVLFGAENQETARRLREQLSALLAAGGFHLRKWASNCPALLANMPRRDHELAFTDNKGDQKVKVLGLIWNPGENRLGYGSP
ncbi:hypothetical protein RF55_8288 [Lasius niger]|uniref:Peptidase A2 domain-containing protein n=1 Tax=Lasius niger TaxID=67767 RepID=A0A0J7KNI7_LASNI|nr:hypothetical protein RF55_8288 [Lasius niger]